MSEFAEFTKIEKDQDPPPSEDDNTLDNTPVDDDDDDEEGNNEDEPAEEPAEDAPVPDASTGDFFKQLGALTFNNPKAMALVSESMSGQQQEENIPTPDFAVTEEVYDEMTETEKHLYGGMWKMHEKNVRIENAVRQGQNMTIFQRQSEDLKEKFGKDVDVNKVLQYASQRGIATLEDAYKSMNWGNAPGKEANEVKHRQRNKSMQTVTGSKNRGGGGQSKPLQLTKDQRKVLRGLNDSGANISEQRYAQHAQAIVRERQDGTYGRAGAGKIKSYLTIKE